MSYAETDTDLNDDGTVDATDQALTKALRIWRRETPTSPWLPVASSNSTEMDDIEALIGGFTGYAIAY
jgi:hypothetical protein